MGGSVRQAADVRRQIDPGVVAGGRLPAGGDLVAPHVGSGVVVVFREPRTGGHVEEVTHGRALEGGAPEQGHVVRDQASGVECARPHQGAGEGAGQRLGHRLEEMARVPRHAVAVLLDDDPALVQGEEAVGVRSVQVGAERRRRATDGAKRKVIDLPWLGGQLKRRSIATADPRRRDELPDVLERPAVPGRVLPVRERHESVRSRRAADHQPKLASISRHDLLDSASRPSARLPSARPGTSSTPPFVEAGGLPTRRSLRQLRARRRSRAAPGRHWGPRPARAGR